MKQSKIKPKYLNKIKLAYKDNTNNNILNTLEKKLLKSLTPLMWIILMILWGIIPSIILNLLGIDPDKLNNITKYTIMFINDLIFISILIKTYYKDFKTDFKNYFNNNFKFNLKQSISYWLIGLLIMIISNAIIAIITNGQLAENEEAIRNLINIVPIYMVFQIAIYAPIVEELIFRKSIRTVINNKYLFALTSGLIFGGLHVITSLTNVTGLLYLIPYCSLGIIFGLLYAKSNNIFSTIIAHAIHNSLALILYLTTL